MLEDVELRFLWIKFTNFLYSKDNNERGESWGKLAKKNMRKELY